MKHISWLIAALASIVAVVGWLKVFDLENLQERMSEERLWKKAKDRMPPPFVE